MLSVIDTETSNHRSIINAFRRIGVESELSSEVADVERASAFVLPGVGSFERGMAKLHENGVVEILRRRVTEEGIPVFGICLGMQLLADTSDEHGSHEGLGLIPGHVAQLDPGDIDFRVPNIGWCDTTPARASVLFPDAGSSDSFYFAHSFHLQCGDQADSSARIDFAGEAITVAVQRDNIFGVQFHPEKSQDAGLDLLHNFLTWLRENGRTIS